MHRLNSTISMEIWHLKLKACPLPTLTKRKGWPELWYTPTMINSQKVDPVRTDHHHVKGVLKPYLSEQFQWIWVILHLVNNWMYHERRGCFALFHPWSLALKVQISLLMWRVWQQLWGKDRMLPSLSLMVSLTHSLLFPSTIHHPTPWLTFDLLLRHCYAATPSLIIILHQKPREMEREAAGWWVTQNTEPPSTQPSLICSITCNDL